MQKTINMVDNLSAELTKEAERYLNGPDQSEVTFTHLLDTLKCVKQLATDVIQDRCECDCSSKVRC